MELIREWNSSAELRSEASKSSITIHDGLIITRGHAKIIAGAVGDAVLRIEHIGSTLVPGLPAKPIIDILLVVANSADESLYLPGLELAGYELRVREPEFYEHRMLRTPPRDVHLHVFSPGSPEIDRYRSRQ